MSCLHLLDVHGEFSATRGATFLVIVCQIGCITISCFNIYRQIISIHYHTLPVAGSQHFLESQIR